MSFCYVLVSVSFCYSDSKDVAAEQNVDFSATVVKCELKSTSLVSHLCAGCHTAASRSSQPGSGAAAGTNQESSAPTRLSPSPASVYPGPACHGASGPRSSSTHAYACLWPSTATVLPASMFHQPLLSCNSVHTRIQVCFTLLMTFSLNRPEVAVKVSLHIPVKMLISDSK